MIRILPAYSEVLILEEMITEMLLTWLTLLREKFKDPQPGLGIFGPQVPSCWVPWLPRPYSLED